jgi:hypothetical protein
VAATLACTRPAAASLVLVPDQSLLFSPGKAQTLRATMQLYANQTWTGSVATASSGPLHADVTPASFDLSGEGDIQVAIDVPATQAAGVYPIVVSASAPGSPPAQATITVVGRRR